MAGGMLEHLDERLRALRARVAERDRVRTRLERVRADLHAAERTAAARRADVEREGEDVRALEGMGLTALFATLLGDKKEKLRAERKALVAATLAHQEAVAAREPLRRELEALERQLADLGALEATQAAVLEQKARYLAETGHAEAEAILALGHEQARLAATLGEIGEAIAAGEDAVEKLAACRAALGSAAGWGTFDLLGGGLIATAVKHSHVDDARGHARRAQQALSRFHRELADVGRRAELEVEVDGFLGFVDYFFDGLIVDWVVQSRIQQATRNVERTRRALEDVLDALERRGEAVEARSRALTEERARRIEAFEEPGGGTPRSRA